MENKIKYTVLTEDSKHLFIECLKKIIIPSISKSCHFTKTHLEHAIGYLTDREKSKLLSDLGFEYNSKKYNIHEDFYIPFKWKFNKDEIIKIQKYFGLKVKKNDFDSALKKLPEQWFLIMKQNIK